MHLTPLIPQITHEPAIKNNHQIIVSVNELVQSISNEVILSAREIEM